MTLQGFVPLAGLAIRNPREAAVNMLSMGVPSEVVSLLFGLAVALSAILTGLTGLVRPIPDGIDPERVIVLPPLVFAFVLAFVLLGFSWGVFRVGRAMGGTGAFAETLLLTVFLQLLVIAAQAAELALIVVAPPLAPFFVLVVMIMAFWINLNFVDALHGFGSLLKSFFVVIMVSVGLLLALTFLLTLTGFTVEGTA